MTQLDLQRACHRAAPARRWLAGGGLAAAVLLGGAIDARAQDVAGDDAGAGVIETDAADPAPGPSAAPSYTFELTAGVWLPRLNGDSDFGIGQIDLEEDMDLDSSEAAFTADITLRFLDRWSARLTGYQFSADDSGAFRGSPTQFGTVILLPGDEYSSTLDIDSYALEVGCDLWHPVSDATADLRIGLMGGVRYLEVEHEVKTLTAGRERGEGDWVALYGGGMVDLNLRPQSGILAGRSFGIDVAAGFGFDVNGEQGIYVQIVGGVVVELIPHVHFNLGYRLMYADFTDDDYTFSGGLRGLFVGGRVTF